MNTLINKILKEEKIEYSGIIPFSECNIINQSLLDRSWPGDVPQKSVIVICVPYFTGNYPERNISLYAIPRDYHLYFRQLYERIIPQLSKEFPDFIFKGYADSSPIGETLAAAKAGIGVIGDKFQLINDKYGSYTFIGEIITDMEFNCYDLQEIKYCCHCGACTRACPVKEGCFSEMTQRKGVIDAETTRLIKETGMAWGCDICRTSCPMNKNAAITPISFFHENLLPFLSSEYIQNVSKKDFIERAYSWRGKKTILRNIYIYESKSQNNTIKNKK